jgi:plasmid replication initiation protein
MKITKSNKLIEARYHLKLSEQRIILSSISLIEAKSVIFPDSVTVTAVDLVRIYGIDDATAYRTLMAMGNFLESGRNSITLKDTDSLSHKCVWVSSTKYYKKEGRLVLAFSPDVKEYLQGLKKQFTTYNLQSIAQLKTGYSIRLYELIVRFSKTHRLTLTVQELKDILKIPNDTYKVFSDFKKRVIVPSIKEIKESSDINIVDVIYKKTKRSVTHLHFFFEKK